MYIDSFQTGFENTAETSMAPAAKLGLAILAVLSFKVFLSLQVGPEVLEAVVADLAQGGLTERLAAKMLMLDDVSRIVVEAIAQRMV